MKKKFAILLASLSLCAFSLSACGGDDSDDSGKDDGKQETTKLEKNAKCNSTDECKSGLECREESAGSGKKCLDKVTATTKAGKNEECTAEPGCEGSLVCEASSDNKSYCRVAEGNECAEDKDCIKDHECREESAGGQKKCLAKLPDLGEECTNKCKDELICEADSEGNKHHCKVDANKKCTDDKDCIKDHECIGSTDNKTCKKLVDKGQECLNDDDCKTKFCRKADGATDTDKGMCDLYLKDHTCTANSECKSGNCNASSNPAKCTAVGCTNSCAADETCTNGGICIKDSIYNSEPGTACTSDGFVEFCKPSTGFNYQFHVRCENNKIVIDDCNAILSDEMHNSCTVTERTVTTDSGSMTKRIAYCPVGSSALRVRCEGAALGTPIDEPLSACYGKQIVKELDCSVTAGSNYYGIPLKIENCPAGKTCVQAESSPVASCQ